MNNLFSRTLELTATEDMYLDTAMFHSISHLVDLYVLASKISDFEMITSLSNDIAGIMSLVNRLYPYRVAQYRSILSKEYPVFPYDTFFLEGGEADET